MAIEEETRDSISQTRCCYFQQGMRFNIVVEGETRGIEFHKHVITFSKACDSILLWRGRQGDSIS